MSQLRCVFKKCIKTGWGGGGACRFRRNESHRSVVDLDVLGKVNELDEFETVVLAPTLVGLRRAHVVQVDALVHLVSCARRRKTNNSLHLQDLSTK